MKLQLTFTLSLSACLLILTGCNLAPKKSPTQFYVLSEPAAATQEQVLPHGPRLIGVEVASLPEYLKRNNLVWRLDEGRVHVDGVYRWAEPLEKGITRVVSAGLQDLLPGSTVMDVPWSRPSSPEIVLRLSFTRFEVDASGVAHARGHTHAYEGDSRRSLLSQPFAIKVQATGLSPTEQSLALSEALQELAAQVALQLPTAG
jgi:uncharacterized lipoprotein YmbA